jgi:hypothetical protein
MPFTLSHVAAVVPAFRPLSRAQVFAAAVIGSMVPDFGLLLLLPNTLIRWHTHSFEGLFSFCLPAGLCAYWITLLLIKPALLEVVPDRPYLRLRAAPASASIMDLRHWLYAALAVLFGAVTHLIWDDFTHEDARGVRMFPVLTDYGEMGGHSMRLYGWLQYGSSILGLTVVAAALMLWWRHAPAPIRPPQRRLALVERVRWLALYLLPPLLAIAWSLRHSAGGTGDVLRLVAVAGMRGTIVSLVLVSALIRARLAF